MPSGSETILLVDDDPDILEVSKEILEIFGYIVHGVSSRQEAITFYKENKDAVSLIILDMIMPGISESKTLDLLWEIEPSAKIILSSGYSLEDQAKQIIAKGYRGFIQKPFDMVQISRTVREVLDG